jgi:hypothetical protein
LVELTPREGPIGDPGVFGSTDFDRLLEEPTGMVVMVKGGVGEARWRPEGLRSGALVKF